VRFSVTDARPGLTLASAAATLLAAATCAPLLGDLGWWWPTLALVVLVALTGGLARAVRIPWFLVAALQFAVVTGFVTATHGAGTAALGVVPTSATVDALRATFEGGFTDIDRLAVPVPSTDGITLIAVAGLGLVAVVVDLLAAGLRRPALAGLPLLGVYVVPAAVLPDGLAWPWFALAALGWLALLAAGQYDALGRWGRRVGRIGSTSRAAAGAITVVVVTAALAVVLPGVGDGAFDGVADRRIDARGDRTGDRVEAVHDVTRLDVTLTLEEHLTRSEQGALPVLDYVSDQGPQYLRLAVVEPAEDGGAWRPPQPDLDAGGIYDFNRESAAAIDATTVGSPFGSTTIGLGPIGELLLFRPLPYGTVNIVGLADWRWDGRTSTVFAETAAPTTAGYTADAVAPDTAPYALRGSATRITDPADLALPSTTPAEVATLAREVTAGATTPYDQAVALQRWLRTAFTYDVRAPGGDTSDVIAAFLRERRGYCQHFAATFTLMARSLGIPTRVVLGFTPGTPAPDGTYAVTTSNYHSWPEVSFDGVGWVRFEPTPRAGGAVDVPAYSGPPVFPPNQPAPGDEPSAAPAPAPSPAVTGRAVPAPGTSSTEGVAAEGSGVIDVARRITVGLLAALVLTVVAAAPAIARELRHRRRRRTVADPAAAPSDAVECAWSELADTARDLGVPWPVADSPRRTASTFVDGAGLNPPAEAAVQVLVHDVEQVRYAPEPRPSGVTAEALRIARDATWARAGRGRRLRARLLPASLIRRP
jgi:hypothetical protein